nr:unnamed protein product [Digitaria exilis]
MGRSKKMTRIKKNGDLESIPARTTPDLNATGAEKRNSCGTETDRGRDSSPREGRWFGEGLRAADWEEEGVERRLRSGRPAVPAGNFMKPSPPIQPALAQSILPLSNRSNRPLIRSNNPMLPRSDRSRPSLPFLTYASSSTLLPRSNRRTASPVPTLHVPPLRSFPHALPLQRVPPTGTLSADDWCLHRVPPSGVSTGCRRRVGCLHQVPLLGSFSAPFMKPLHPGSHRPVVRRHGERHPPGDRPVVQHCGQSPSSQRFEGLLPLKINRDLPHPRPSSLALQADVKESIRRWRQDGLGESAIVQV